MTWRLGVIFVLEAALKLGLVIYLELTQDSTPKANTSLSSVVLT